MPESPLERARGAIERLLEVLPDGRGTGAAIWDWCWDELDGESQDLVKQRRQEAVALLKELSPR